MSEIRDRMHILFEKLVPDEGKASTAEGEMIRAISRIGYRYLNDGDYFYCGYGIENCGSDHTYLVTASPIKSQLRDILRKAVYKTGDNYEEVINEAIAAIVEYVEARGDNLESNEVDSLEDFEPEFEDEPEDEEDDWDDQDLYIDDEVHPDDEDKERGLFS